MKTTVKTTARNRPHHLCQVYCRSKLPGMAPTIPMQLARAPQGVIEPPPQQSCSRAAFHLDTARQPVPPLWSPCAVLDPVWRRLRPPHGCLDRRRCLRHRNAKAAGARDMRNAKPPTRSELQGEHTSLGQNVGLQIPSAFWSPHSAPTPPQETPPVNVGAWANGPGARGRHRPSAGLPKPTPRHRARPRPR